MVTLPEDYHIKWTGDILKKGLGVIWKPTLKVEIPEPLAKLFCAEDIEMLRQTLALDPRPSYHDDPQRIYGMPFGDYDVRFRVEDDTLAVVGCNRL